MTKLSDKVRELALGERYLDASQDEAFTPRGYKLVDIIADVEALEVALEETKQVAIASRWCSEFYSQVPGPGQIAQMFGGLLMGLSEYRRTDVRNAKIEAYEDARRLCWLRDYGDLPRAGDDIADDLAAAIDALKAVEDK